MALCSVSRTAGQLHATVSGRTVAVPRARCVAVRAYKVQINQEGTVHTLEIPEGKTILEVALDKGLDLPHDCKLGVCMTCPAKLVRA
jgi:ferredoxin